jgi:predicted phage gp36 major capsid-like protein
MLFGDMKKFYVRKVGAPALFVARERFAPDNGILGYIRFDGCLSNTAAIKHMATPAS